MSRSAIVSPDTQGANHGHITGPLEAGGLLIGRQMRTAVDKLIDLLAIDANGTVIIIALKHWIRWD